MSIVFLLAAAYCLIQAFRRFANKRPPMFIEKDPTLVYGQIRAWSRLNGYSLLFWTAFAVTMAAYMLFYHWAILILLVLFAAGGVLFSMKGSAVLHDKSGKYASEEKRPGAAPRKKKKKKKKK